MSSTPPNSTRASRAKMAMRLANLAQMLSGGAATADEADRFYRELDDVLDLPPELESEVTAQAMGQLTQLGDEGSARYLADELDQECQLFYTLDKANREQACLLFALPVVVPSGDSVQQHAQDETLFTELHDILSESDVINRVASFGLIPRLFSFSELFAKSYGQLRDLTRALSLQVLSGAQVLQLPETFPLGPLDGASCSPYVDLYFVVGAVCTRSYELDEVFPDMPDEPRFVAEEVGRELEGGPYNMGPNGETDDGEPWEKPFTQAFDDAFGVIQGSLTVLPPDGLCEDLRRGLALAREVGLSRMFEVNGHDLPSEPGAGDNDPAQQRYYRLSALKDIDNELFITVSCLDAVDGTVLDEVDWQVLMHETEAEAAQILVAALEDAAVLPECPLADAFNPYASLRLN